MSQSEPNVVNQIGTANVQEIIPLSEIKVESTDSIQQIESYLESSSDISMQNEIDNHLQNDQYIPTTTDFLLKENEELRKRLSELKQEFSQEKRELKNEIFELKQELKTEKSLFKNELSDLRLEFKNEKTDLKKEIIDLKKENDHLRSELKSHCY